MMQIDTMARHTKTQRRVDRLTADWFLGGMIIIVLLAWDGMSSAANAGFGCTVSATNIAFGNVDVGSGQSAASTATITVTCSEADIGDTIRMCVSINGGSSYDSSSREMLDSSSALDYQLYTDSANTTVWGSWINGLYSNGLTWDIKVTSGSFTASRTIYGKVLPNQRSVTSGSYSSTLSLTSIYRDDTSKNCAENNGDDTGTTFIATATVLDACTVSATNLNFGSTGFLTGSIDATSATDVKCGNGTPYQVGLSAGNGGGATAYDRKMTLSSMTVDYGLYRDSSRTSIWGETVGVDTVAGTGTGSSQSLTVYGRVPGQSTPTPGTYSDTIIVTVTY